MTSETFTNIFEAAALGTIDDVRHFVEEQGADVNEKSESGYTPLHSAARNPHVEIFEYLISQGADVNARDNTDSTPLLAAASLDINDIPNIAVVKCLVSAGADVNAKNCFGKTPLYYAAIVGSAEVLQYLIAQGADANAWAYGGTEEKKRILREARESHPVTTFTKGAES